MKIVNRLIKAFFIVLTQLFYSLGLYLVALVFTGFTCTLTYVTAEFMNITVAVSVWRLWLIMSVVAWLCLEVYVAVKVFKFLHGNKSKDNND